MRRTWMVIFVLVGVLQGCGGSGAAAPPPDPDLLVEAMVGPDGGELVVADPASPYAGTRLVVPPGALGAKVLIRILVGSLPDVPASVEKLIQLGPAARLLGDAPADIKVLVADDLGGAIAEFQTDNGVMIDSAAWIVGATAP